MLSYVSTVGFEAVSMGWILSALAPGLQGPVLYGVLGESVHLGSLLLGLGGMAVITLVNYRGAKSTATFQDVMTYGLIAISLLSAEGRFPTEWSFFIVWAILGALFWRSAGKIRRQLSEEERRSLILS